jgi:dihydrofolate reductase
VLTLYNVVSKDGFISRLDGSEDFIPEQYWLDFLALCKQYNAFIMGRKTYEAIQQYDSEAVNLFEELPIKKIIVTNNKNFVPQNGYIVAHSPNEAVSLAPDALVSSGPTLNSSLLREGLVQKIIQREVPVSIGNGIKPFADGLTITVPITKIS